ncbi:ATP-binding protein [Psychrosphaera sp. 1_MG-2023]|uniref:ATP-binding protein n=1 Tax=Psychrosphaera sp. 1_MG-2023 TaxID=3062643 RepID=UPI0026E183FE|nr:ATP-binding protein [Psychrosphaera sp. 1_MG-2023]MDO6720785.1 ATP-binding protein [Psychrosphaera sp. 1_MG-2023]
MMYIELMYIDLVEGQEMETGLEEIYLHHSYFKGRLTPVECLGHTNNTGGNGAGKTTLLSLIPVFYGMEPSKVVDRSAGKLSFVDHYLPTKYSMIVFEYKKEGELKCAVLYRSRDSVAYRFVDGSANEALFNQVTLDELNKIASVKDWLREIVANTFEVSKQISTSIDYRSVIQNDKQRLRIKRKAKASLTPIAHKFSLCTHDSQMRHIESLASVLMRHDKLLAQFKLMVVDSFLTDQIEIGEAPYHKDDTEYVSSIESLIELDKHKDKFSESINQYEELKESWSYLLSYQGSLQQELITVAENLGLSTSKIIKLKSERTELTQQYQQDTSDLNSTHQDLSNQAETKKNLISSIYDERERWDEERDIATKLSEYQILDSLKARAKKDAKHLNQLLESVSAERQAYEANILQQEKEADQFKIAVTQKITELRDKRHQLELSLEQKLREKSKEFNARLEALTDKRTNQSNRLLKDLNELKVQYEIAGKYTKQEELELNELGEKIESLNKSVINDIAQQKAAIGSDIQNSKKIRDDLLIQINRLIKQLKGTENKRIEITRQLNPEDGTVRSFLNKNLANWRTSIGKVLRPELLALKALSPEILDDTERNSIYGISLNLENIPLPEEAQSDEILSQQRDELGREIENIKSDIGSLEKKVTVQTKLLNELELKIEGLERDEKRIKGDIEKYTLLKQKTAQRINDDITQRQVVIEQKITESVEKHEGFDQETLEIKIEENNKFQQEELAFRANASGELGLIDDEISVKETSIVDSQNDLKQRLKDLRTAFDSLLEEKDIDAKTVEAARLRKEESESKYNEVKAFDKEISEYKIWESSAWSKVEHYENEYSEVSDKVSIAFRELKDAKEQFEKGKGQLTSEIDKVSNEVEKYQEDEKSIQSTLEVIELHTPQIPVGHQPIHFDSPIPIEITIQSSKECVSSINKLRHKISSAVKKVGDILLSTGNANNKVLHLWRNMEEQRIASSIHDKFSEDFHIESVADVKRLIEESIPDIKAVILESIKTVGARYIRFYQALDGLKRKVKSVSSKLVKEINTSNNFSALGNIRVELVSKVDEFDLWADLKSFNSVWNKWGESGRESLPEKEFIVAFTNVIAELKQSKITSSIDSLVDIDISMTENGRPVNIRTDADLKNISSTGISKLAVIVVFCGMTRYLCKDRNITIHWPLDELGELSDENVMLLFEFMDQNNISLFCAQPNPSVVLLRYFTTKNHVDKHLGIKKYVSRQAKKTNPLTSNLLPEVKMEEANV